VVKVKDKKKRKNNTTNNIGVEEDEVRREEVSQETQKFKVLSVANMAIMQRSVTQISVLVVVRSDTT